MQLKKYFIEFEKNEHWVNRVGVTAWTKQDAMNLIQEFIFPSEELPKLRNFREIKSLDELDQGHVIPNMEEFVFRGIWYPKGYKKHV